MNHVDIAEPWDELDIIERYSLGLALLLLAYALRKMIDPIVGDNVPLFAFVISTLVAAIFLGRGPALLNVVLGALLAEWSFMAPRFSWHLTAHQQGRFVTYGLFCLGGIILGEVLHRHRRILREKIGEIESLAARETAAQAALEVSQQQLSDSAELGNRIKSAFLANMSHEIRTPLNAIMGFSEILLDPALSIDERRRCVSTISRNGQALTRLIDDILDMAKIEANKLEVDQDSLTVAEVLADVQSILGEMARRHNVVLRLLVESGVPQVIETDPVRLRQILINIVGNAIKFTRDGNVTVAVRVLDESVEDSICLGFQVSDEGAGIAPEHHGLLFNSFEQSDASATRRYGGTGLGLALARRLARALGGDVQLVDSALGRGSTFLISVIVGNKPKSMLAKWRMMSATENKHLKHGENHGGADLVGRKILVVEDTPDSQYLIRRILQKAGAEVDIAADGGQALIKADGVYFDAILMDIQMPIMDGFEATAILRRRGLTLPIIALTAHSMPEDRDRTRTSGFDDHITKPIHPASLISAIRRHIELAQPRRAAFQAKDSSEAGSPCEMIL